MGYGSSDYNMGQADAAMSAAIGGISASRRDQRNADETSALLRQKQYVAGGLENAAANRSRKVRAWDDVVWEIVKRIKDFDPETRYRILGVCRGKDATPEDTMRALRECQEFQFQKIKAVAPKDNSDTEVPALREKYENTAI